MAEGIRIEGLPRLERIMREVGSLRPVKRGLAKGAIHLRRKIRTYPEQRPPTNPKYQYIRGVGTKYVPTGRIQKTSENHGKSWGGQSGLGGLQWTIGSDTSYGPFLQSVEKQTSYHKTTGWKTTETVKDEEEATVNAAVKREVDLALAGQ